MISDMDHRATADASPSSGHPGTEARVWAARISECWRQSTEAIIRTGQMLIEAKRDVGHGGWGEVLSGLPFGERHAQMLMAIASDIRLSNPQRIALLPPSWGAIYDLTRLADEDLERGFQQGIIRPDMIRADVDQIRALTRPLESQANATEGKAGMAGEHDVPVRRSTAGTGLQVGEASADLPATSEHMDVTAGETAPNLPSGGLAIAHRRVEEADSLDFFPTPPWATRALFEHVLVHLKHRGFCKWQEAWEPACGEGHMAEVMAEYFKRVYASDKADYGYGVGDHDFLTSTAQIPFDWIVTNPPFNDSTEFVLKALKRAGTGVAMFVRLTWLESVGRYEKIFRDHPPTVVAIFSERVPLHKGRWEEDGATMTAYIWLVWIRGAEPRAPFWIPPGCRKTLTRASDAKRFGVETSDEGKQTDD